MTETLITLLLIMTTAFVCPILAQSIPGKPIPETVFLIVCGALLGPHAAGLMTLTEPVNLLSELGLSFLFLLAGYEIDPKVILGRQGKRGLVSWFVSFGLAAALVYFAIGNEDHLMFWAAAIALTTTALGTLMPILKERGLMGTPVGNSVLAYGTWGELAPVIAMAVLLSSRSGWQTASILLGFILISVALAVIPAFAKLKGSKFFSYIKKNRTAASQPALRLVILLLVLLVTIAEVFHLDIVLGAFAAGFVLRHIIPDGDHILEEKIEAVANGFLVPLFFIVSGAKIDLKALTLEPLLFFGFIALLLLVRAIPVHVSLALDRKNTNFTPLTEQGIALYCTTALPLIVAVTSVAVSGGAMDQTTSSVLVSAGAVTVFLMPFLAQLCERVVDTHPVEAVREIAHDPHDARGIVADHLALARMLSAKERRANIFNATLQDPERIKREVEVLTERAEQHLKDHHIHTAEHILEAQAARAAHAEAVAHKFAEERRRRLYELRREHTGEHLDEYPER